LINTPYIDIHTHRKTEPQSGCVSIINLFANEAHIPDKENNTFFSMGLHPWHIDLETLTSDLINIENLLINKTIIAIGETGLDRAIKTSMEIQKEVFEQHLVLAQQFEKPAIVHAVHTYPDIVEVYNKSRVNVNMVFHGFNGNLEIAEQLIKRGFYLSFGEHLFNSTRKAVGVFKEIPLGNIFLETDESEKSITAIYDKAAEIKGLGRSVLKDNIYNNFTHCFGKII